MLKIEKGVLMPPRVHCQKLLKQLKEMEVGDSFPVSSDKEYKRLRMLAYRNEIKISGRKVDNEGWRIWRIEG